MAKYFLCIVFAAVALVWLPALKPASAQIQYARGQDVTPAFEGWQRNPDDTITMFFGYMNRNYEEEVDVPIGPNNAVDPGGDQGQPTHFYPRRQRFVFKVVLPKDWDPKQKVVWTLTVRGQTNKANGNLLPTWEVDKEVIMQNSGSRARSELPPGSKKPAASEDPPLVTGSGPQTVTLPGKVSLSVTAEGKPRPGAGPGDDSPNTRSLRIRWVHYRGPGSVSFDSPVESVVAGKQLNSRTSASFSSPGTYWIRAIASDGAFEAFHDVTVTVNPASGN